MKQARILIAMTILLLSACALTPEEIAKNNKDIKQFLEEYPQAQSMFTEFSETQLGVIPLSIKEECMDNKKIEKMYRYELDDPQSENRLILWMFYDKEKITQCSQKIKKGTSEPVVANSEEKKVQNQDAKEEVTPKKADNVQTTKTATPPRDTYPKYLIEKDIGRSTYFKSEKINSEISIPNNPSEGYLASYDIASAEVWVYNSEKEIQETLQETMFNRIYDNYPAKFNDFGVYLGTYEKRNDLVYFTKNPTTVMWAHDNYVIRITGYRNDVVDAYLEKYPSDLQPKQHCKDTDHGKDYTTKGFVIVLDKDMTQMIADRCDQNYLVETYCENDALAYDQHECDCDINRAICGVDATPPELSSMYPLPGQSFAGSSVNVYVRTNEVAVCKSKITGTSWENMASTESGFNAMNHNKLFSVSPGQSYTVDISCTDEEGNTATDTTNFNVLTGIPDLTILEIILEPANPQIGDMVQTKIRVKNIGDGPSTNAISISCSVQYPSESGARSGGGGYGPRIEAGETVIMTVCGHPFSESGTYTITVKVNSDQTLEESDLTNNEKTLVVNIA